MSDFILKMNPKSTPPGVDWSIRGGNTRIFCEADFDIHSGPCYLVFLRQLPVSRMSPMPIYRIKDNKILPIKRTTFARQGVRERQDLQEMLKTRIDIVAPDTLIVAEEFSYWEDSRRRIDLLGIDKNANLVVIELKRSEDGGHMELQALRYASMVSTLTFDKLAAIYADYLTENNIHRNAAESLLEFLEWEEPEDDQFAQEVRIVLVSAEFSKELTTSVMWLNDFGLDIRCVRMHPYISDNETLLDIHTVIPIPEAADYQVQIREKKQKERAARTGTKDLTKFDVFVNGQKIHQAQNKRRMMFHIISYILENGYTPEKIAETIPQKRKTLFEVFEGKLNTEQVREAIMENDTGGKRPRAERYFIGEDELFHFDGKTYALTNQWGIVDVKSFESLSQMFSDLKIEIKPTEQNN